LRLKNCSACWRGTWSLAADSDRQHMQLFLMRF
jgi:hypothetical protein